MRVPPVVALRVAAVASSCALGAMHLISVRQDETWEVAWNGPSPPQYGWPLPWATWSGASSLEWVISPLAFVAAFALHVLPFIALAALCEWRVQHRPGRASQLLRGAVVACAVVSIVPTLSTLVPLAFGHVTFGALEPLRAPQRRLWVGRFEPFPDTPSR